MSKKYDVSMAQEYEDNGETKTRWVNLGIAFEKDGKPPRIKLNALPIPDKNGEIWINLFEQKPKDQGGQGGGNSYAQARDGDGGNPWS